MKIFKQSKKFKKVKRLKNTIQEQAKEIERLTGEKKVMRQKLDLVIDNMQNI